MVILVQKELGELVVLVEAKDMGAGHIMSQVELRSPSGPLRRYSGPRNTTSCTKHFRYSRTGVMVSGLDEAATAANPEQIAFWIYTTAMTNWEGRDLSMAKIDRLHCENRDGGLESRLTRAYMEDATSIMDSVLGCCVALHLTEISIRYNSSVSRRIGSEKVLECWDRRIIQEVMKS